MQPFTSTSSNKETSNATNTTTTTKKRRRCIQPSTMMYTPTADDDGRGDAAAAADSTNSSHVENSRIMSTTSSTTTGSEDENKDDNNNNNNKMISVLEDSSSLSAEQAIGGGVPMECSFMTTTTTTALADETRRISASSSFAAAAAAVVLEADSIPRSSSSSSSTRQSPPTPSSSSLTEKPVVAPVPLSSTPLLRVAIIGCGLAGLATAVALERHGFYGLITIYERDPSFHYRLEGYGLTLTYQPNGVLYQLGILDQIANADCPSRSHYLFGSKHGDIVGYYGRAFTTNTTTTTKNPTGRGQRGNLRVPRQRVREILIHQLKNTTIMWGHQLIDMKHQVIPTTTTTSSSRSNDDTPTRTSTTSFKETKSPDEMIQNDHDYHNDNSNSNGNLKQHSQGRNADRRHKSIQTNVIQLYFRQHYDPNSSSALSKKTTTTTTATATTSTTKCVEVDVVIAADGIHSAVVQHWIPKAPKPTSLGIRLILGLTDASEPHRQQQGHQYKINSVNDKTASDNNNNNNNVVSSLSSDEMVTRTVTDAAAAVLEDHHHLLKERGFYTITGTHRLFVMPYTGSSLDLSIPVRYMWQLSFREENETNENNNNNGDDSSKFSSSRRGATTSAGFTSGQLWSEALNITKGWHKPVETLIRSTPVQSVWGTMLCDRNPTQLYQLLLQHPCHRVIITGDALHAMSPFKGQGANQSLADGLTVAKWLMRTQNTNPPKDQVANGEFSTKKSARMVSSVEVAVRGCLREIVQRTAKVVQSSREASQFWHSPAVLEEQHKFAGVSNDHLPQLLHRLKENSIKAETPNLDESIGCILQEMRLNCYHHDEDSAVNTDDYRTMEASKTQEQNRLDDNQTINGQSKQASDPLFSSQAITATQCGDLGQLRRMSWLRSTLLYTIRDATTGSTLLHVAAEYGHIQVVHWLITEADCNCNCIDHAGRRPIDMTTDPAIVELLERLNH